MQVATFLDVVHSLVQQGIFELIAVGDSVMEASMFSAICSLKRAVVLNPNPHMKVTSILEKPMAKHQCDLWTPHEKNRDIRCSPQSFDKLDKKCPMVILNEARRYDPGT